MDAPSEPELDPYVDFTREEWSRLRASTPLSLAEKDLAALRGLGEPMPMLEVEEVYLPLSRLLNLRVAATRELGWQHVQVAEGRNRGLHRLGRLPLVGHVGRGHQGSPASCLDFGRYPLQLRSRAGH